MGCARVVLARVVTAVEPALRLPALTGGPMSLNTFVALVGPSGSGKDAAIEAGSAAVDVGHVEVRTPGSGEGIAHAYVQRVKAELVQHTTSVLFIAREVDSLAALVARQSATLGAELRIAYAGAQLGFAYADPTRRLTVAAHAYRLCLLVGVQPERAGPLLDESVSGTPQRFVWLPATDPDAPDERPAEPKPLPWRDPLWTPTRAIGDERVTEMPVCDEARQIIDHARCSSQAGPSPVLSRPSLRTFAAPLLPQRALCPRPTHLRQMLSHME